jgi:hypothetical protein
MNVSLNRNLERHLFSYAVKPDVRWGLNDGYGEKDAKATTSD